MARAPKPPKQVGTLNHPENRVNIPTAEMADLAAMQEERFPLAPVSYLHTHIIDNWCPLPVEERDGVAG